MLVVLVPAHNEENTLPEALGSLSAQSVVPDQVVVVADDCSDGTVAVATRLGADVVETAGNTARKAGALNQALDTLLPTLADG
ncbi:MAG: hypothetical protein QOF00_1324, partial [Pseudonocardiales bacterium]|nr:hypothetical protein [Pseudonocardiales bacterium]